MNLADIRKKALEEREQGRTAAPVSPQDSLPEDLFGNEEEIGFEAVAEAYPLSGPTAVEPPSLPASNMTVPEAKGRSFNDVYDPVAALLAGRDQIETVGDEDAPEESAENDGNLEFLCCRVASEEYAVNIQDIKEIIKPREMTDVPRTPQFVSGVFSLRGVIVPVFDMRRRLGLDEAGDNPRERIIVVKKGAGLCGLHVDEVLEVVKIQEQTIEPPPSLLEGIDREFVTGIGRHEGRMLILLNLEKILDLHLY